MKILNRKNQEVEFDKSRIVNAITEAMKASNQSRYIYLAEPMANRVEVLLSQKHINDNKAIEIDEVQNYVENEIMSAGLFETAKAYILYRASRDTSRSVSSLTEEVGDLFDAYLDEADWRIQENSNMSYSINGLNNYVREKFTKRYWLYKKYSQRVRDAHLDGKLHIHDLGFLGPYCAGWDCRLILIGGFGGVASKPEFDPPKHLGAFLGQIVNSTFTTQGETAGAQAWTSVDTYAAPFIRYDNLTYEQVKQEVQEYVCQMNVPTRVGFQCPFSNQTDDIVCPDSLKNEHVIIGGEYMPETYGEFQKEMDMFNKAFCEVMLEGDSKGRVFTFPIPTINITNNIDWDSEVVNLFMDMSAKYGNVNFSNYVNSDLSPDDALSMCCRLKLDLSELRKRGGGLFGSNPLTGSIGVVTINMPRLGYESSNEEEFFINLREMMDIAKESLEVKRKIIELNSDRGMYPYSTKYLRKAKMDSGSYWSNHFSTIGLIGMNECLLNLFGYDITTKEGQEFAIKTLTFMRDVIREYQEETGHVYNLEATPGEGACYSLAIIDKKKYPDIITAGTNNPYYTNSTQLPVNFTDDIFEYVELQEELQTLYTGGTTITLYLGESKPDSQACKQLIKSLCENYKIPYVALSPIFSICEDHGYFAGEVETCPICGERNEIWQRVVGYLRPRSNFNIGKQEESNERKNFKIK